MASIADKLTRVSALRGVPKLCDARACGEPPRGAEEIATLLGAACASNHYGEHLLVHNWFSSPEPGAAIGCEQMRGAALDLLLPRLRNRRGIPRCPRKDNELHPEKWLFLDTETTGLAGGTGTYAFLIGIAWWDCGGLQVEQFFLRDYTDEHSVLLALAERLAERPVLVTYNGKTFDWPLLETRFRMTRAIAAPQPAAHLDLLHPARQVWRQRTGSARLADLEDLVLSALPGGLGWDRRYDVRSDMIPQIYFDYLRGGPPMPLLDVLRHNQMDLRGLAALASRMCALLGDPQTADADALELYGISRMLRRRPEDLPRARACYERALRAGLPRAVARAARRELAALAKRERDYARATALWNELVGEQFPSAPAEADAEESVEADFSPPAGRLKTAPAYYAGELGASSDAIASDIEAYEQLAIYYEHRARDPHRALEVTRAALTARTGATGRISREPQRRLRTRLEHRLQRLERKASRELPLSENSLHVSGRRIQSSRRRI